jgi:hypothetical protein
MKIIALLDDWKIRCKSATHSGAFRPPVPVQTGHLFRCDSGHF